MENTHISDKVIHYCWFGNGNKSWIIQRCINSWKVFLPQYEIKQWNEDNYDLSIAPKWVQNALNDKLYAFVSDYVRTDILYKFGGLYLDTDVLFRKPWNFSMYDNDNIIIPVEKTRMYDNNKCNVTINNYTYGINLNCSLIKSKPLQDFFKEVLELYKTFDDDYAIKAKKNNYDTPIISQIYSKCMEKYGFQYIYKEQLLDNNIHIIDNHLFNHCTTLQIPNNLNAVHLCIGSWREKKNSIWQKLC